MGYLLLLIMFISLYKLMHEQDFMWMMIFLIAFFIGFYMFVNYLNLIAESKVLSEYNILIK